MHGQFGRVRGFTLIELLVVIGIIAVIAAILFPVFASTKRAAKKSDCLSNLHEIGLATQLYLGDADDVYPQTRQSGRNPDVEDSEGQLEEPIFKQVFEPILPYTRTTAVFVCPEDADPAGHRCFAIDPDSPDVTSFVVNGYFVFGLSGGSVTNSSTTIYVAERRSEPTAAENPYCNDIYHPWFNASNAKAPQLDMAEIGGAIATQRHSSLANYLFADSHVRPLHWAATYSPPNHNFHLVNQA